MKIETIYKCDYCGKKYNTEEECNICETSHKKFVSLYKQTFDGIGVVPPKYPAELIVELEDDHYALYKFSNPILKENIDDSSDETYNNSNNTSNDVDNTNNSNDITGGYAE